MPSPIVSVSVKGDKDIQRAVNALRNIGKQLAVIHRLMALEAEKWIKKNCQAEGKMAVSSGWRKLSPNTIAARRKEGKGAKILQDTGAMRGSINSKANERDARAGFGDKKAIWHHSGTRPYEIRPKRKRLLRFMTSGGQVSARVVHHPGLAARPLIPTKDQIGPLVVKRLDLYVADLLRKKGSKVRTT